MIHFVIMLTRVFAVSLEIQSLDDAFVKEWTKNGKSENYFIKKIFPLFSSGRKK